MIQVLTFQNPKTCLTCQLDPGTTMTLSLKARGKTLLTKTCNEATLRMTSEPWLPSLPQSSGSFKAQLKALKSTRKQAHSCLAGPESNSTTKTPSARRKPTPRKDQRTILGREALNRDSNRKTRSSTIRTSLCSTALRDNWITYCSIQTTRANKTAVAVRT